MGNVKAKVAPGPPQDTPSTFLEHKNKAKMLPKCNENYNMSLNKNAKSKKKKHKESRKHITMKSKAIILKDEKGAKVVDLTGVALREA